MKRALTDHALMQGSLKKTELTGLELQQLAQTRRTILGDLRSEALSIQSGQHSPYIVKRLERLFSVLDRLDSLANDEVRQWDLFQRVVGRLQNTDLLDHFGVGLQRRMNRILRDSVKRPSRLPKHWKGHHWFLLRVGTLHLAVLGRLLRYQGVEGRKKIITRHAMRVFPETDLWSAEPLFLAVLSTQGGERVAVYCNALSTLPDFFEPGPLTAAQHPDLKGRIRYAGRTVYVWKESEGHSPVERNSLNSITSRVN